MFASLARGISVSRLLGLDHPRDTLGRSHHTKCVGFAAYLRSQIEPCPTCPFLNAGPKNANKCISMRTVNPTNSTPPKPSIPSKRARRFYWSINLGALVSYTLVSYVCQYGLPFLGGRDWGFMAGYSIPCLAMAIAVAVFVAGTPRYSHAIAPTLCWC